MNSPGASQIPFVASSIHTQPILTFEVLKDFIALPDDVLALMEAAEAIDPELGPAWYQNLCHSVFSGSDATQLHILRRNGVVLAALPLLLSRPKLGQRFRALGNFYTCLYAPALSPELRTEELSALLRHLKQAYRPCTDFRLFPLDGSARSFSLLELAFKQAGFQTFSHLAFGNWYLPVAVPYADFLAQRPGEVRSTLKRMGKKFLAAGGQFRIATEPSEVGAAVAAYLAVYSSSWKRPEPYPDFIPGLAVLCAAKGWLRLGVASIGDHPVAAQIWIVANGKAHIYKLAYDARFKEFSPGSLLTAHLMQHTIDVDRVTEVDYLKGDDAYKSQWMTHRRERLGLLAFNLRTVGGIWGWSREGAGRLWRRISRSETHHAEDAR